MKKPRLEKPGNPCGRFEEFVKKVLAVRQFAQRLFPCMPLGQQHVVLPPLATNATTLIGEAMPLA